MIRINLLAVEREKPKKRAGVAFDIGQKVTLVCSLILVATALGIGWWWWALNKKQSDLATQTETAQQNQAIGDANKQVVTIVKKAQQERDVAVTKANQDLEVAKLRLQAAQKQGDALTARGQADANVILLNKQAEAEPLRQQVSAFGGGENYAQFFFYQKVAPSVKTILTNTDGPFADLFKQLATPSGQKNNGTKVTEAKP